MNKYMLFEEKKRLLKERNLPTKEYEQELKKLAEKLKI